MYSLRSAYGISFCLFAAVFFLSSHKVLAEENVKESPATLAGHAILPANSYLATPQDAHHNLQLSGKYTTGVRVDQPNSVEGLSAGRPTGIKLPFKGQPQQGHLGIKHMVDGSYWIITDNGAGAKANSPDFILYLNHYAVDFKTGQFKLLNTVFYMTQIRKCLFQLLTKRQINVT